MSESPAPPLVVVSGTGVEPTSDPPKPASEYVKVIALFTFGAGLFVVGVAFVAALRGGRDVSDSWIAAGTIVSAIAAAFIAYFTFTLWDATREMRESANATAERQFAIMDAQRIAMTAIADAVSISAAAAQGALEAVQEQVAVTKRLHVSQHPPVLRLTDMQIVDSGDGQLSITFGVVNDGDTDATISRTKTNDGFIHRPTKRGLSGTPVERPLR